MSRRNFPRPWRVLAAAIFLFPPTRVGAVSLALALFAREGLNQLDAFCPASYAVPRAARAAAASGLTSASARWPNPAILPLHLCLRMATRARNWCFTSYQNSTELRNTIGEADGIRGLGISYIVWGEEVCPTTGRQHLQGYVQFTEGVTIRTIKRRLDDGALHLERRKGSAAEAIRYCLKRDDDEIEKTVVEFGDRPKEKAGKRTDLDEVRALLSAGKGVSAVLDSGANYQGVRFAEKWLSYKEVGRDPDASPPTIKWYWGPTGSGKSRAACAEATASHGAVGTWWAAGGLRWYDGYDAHGAAILDDFRPEWCKLHVLLRVLDRYPLRVEVKGGFRQWKPSVIYITCPKPPSECYLDCGEDVEQLIRRITVVKEFERVDGRVRVRTMDRA